MRQVDDGGRDEGGSLADLVDADRRIPLLESIPISAIIKVAVIALLFAGVNWRQFPILFGTWRHNPNWSHGFVIPLFSLYLLYARREDLLTATRRVFIWALPMVILSIVLIIISYYPIRTYWFCQLAMIALLFWLVWYLAGTKVIRVTWLPILFLIFALPIPSILYSRIAVPLQNFAAGFSAAILQIFGVLIDVTASQLMITSMDGNRHALTIAEACSGVRSLMAFMALGVAWAYLEIRPIWQRIVLVVSAVPIAILCNVFRVTITSSMYVIDKPELGQDFMHEFTGILMLIPAVGMFWALSKLLEALFVEVEDDQNGQRLEKPAGSAEDADA